jgi:general secretion pathway protein I
MKNGFTLLESLIALVLLAIAIPAITTLFMGAKSSQVGSFAVEQGAQFAESRIDSLRWLGRQTLASAQPLGHPTPTPLATTLNLKGATWTWQLDTAANPVASAGKPGRAGTLTLILNWSQGSAAHSITLQGELP